MSTSQADGDPVLEELEALLDEGVVSGRSGDGEAVELPASPDALASLLPRYRLGCLVGAGGMGQVYDAHDTLLHRRVAIKVVARPGPVVADLMRREREVLAALQHPGIVAVYDCGELSQGQPYYVMQYVEGQDLREYVVRRRLSLEAKLRLVAEIARAVGVAHLLKVVHRDLKPSNIKVTSDGRTMVLDFGLAKFTAAHDPVGIDAAANDSFQTVAHGRVKGTLAYMSPEQAAGERVDSRSDIFALGVILHELLTGRLPRDPEAEGGTPLDWSRLLRSDRALLERSLGRDFPSAVRAILERALDSDPDRRYATAIELADDLEAYLENRPVAAVQRLRRLHLARTFAVRNRRGIAIASVILSVLASIIVMSFARIREERNLAERNAAQAMTERRRAIDRENATRQFLYTADLGQAHRLWHNQQVDKAQALLDRYVPAPDEDDLRTFEWRFLQKLCRNRPLILPGHTADVTAVSYAPGGAKLASADAAGTLRLWDSESGRLLSTLSANSSAIRQIGFSNDGQTLFSIGTDRTLRLWNVESGQQTRSYWWFWRRLNAAAISADGRRMAVADQGGWVYLWKTENGEVTGQFMAHAKRGVNSVAFSPDGTRIATGGKDHTARVWDAQTLEQLAVLQPHIGPVNALSFSTDGERLATGGVDRTLRIWRIAEPATPVFQWFGGDEIVGVGFSQHPEMTWAACKNGTVNYVSTANDRRNTLHTDSERLVSASVTPDLRHIASTSGDRTIQLWRGEQLIEYRQIAGDDALTPTRFALAPSGDLLAVAYYDQRFVDVWELATRRRAGRLDDFAQPVNSVCFSADGQSLLTADMAGQVRIWQVGSWRPAKTLADDPEVVKSAVATAPHDAGYAVADATGGIVLYDLTGEPLAVELKGHDNMPIIDLDYSSDGRLLASAGWDKTIHLWEISSGKLLRVFRGHQGIVNAVRFSPDEKHLASTCADGTVRLWDTETGAEITTLWRLTHETYGLCFSADGRTLAVSSADRTAKGLAQVRMWNLPTMQETLTLEVGNSQITGLSFSPSGDQLIAGVGPGLTGAGILIWEAEPANATSAAR